jgi:hypothetical protein
MTAIARPTTVKDASDELALVLAIALEGGESAPAALRVALTFLAKRGPAHSVLAPEQCNVLLRLLVDIETAADEILPPAIDRHELRDGLQAAQRQVIFWAMTPELRSATPADRIEMADLRAHVLQVSLYRVHLQTRLKQLEQIPGPIPAEQSHAAPEGVRFH